MLVMGNDSDIVDAFIQTLEEALHNFERCRFLYSTPEGARCHEEMMRLKKKADRLFAEYQSSERYYKALGFDGTSQEISDSHYTMS